MSKTKLGPKAALGSIEDAVLQCLFSCGADEIAAAPLGELEAAGKRGDDLTRRLAGISSKFYTEIYSRYHADRIERPNR